MDRRKIEELLEIYRSPGVKGLLRKKLKSFKEKEDKEHFYELIFCLLTPQSKFDFCLEVVESLKKHDELLFSSNLKKLDELLEKKMVQVRFKNNKRKYILLAHQIFIDNGKINISKILKTCPCPITKREFLVKQVKGLGYKEASHFLRNIGYGEDIAILDRHILSALKYFGIIKEIPKSLTPRIYLEIEEKLIKLAKELKVTPGELDFILFLWNKEKDKKKHIKLLEKLKSLLP